jgi:hypothetical protein
MHRLSLHHPAVLHHGRLRRRHRLQPRGVRGDLPARPRPVTDLRAAHRRVADRLEGVRDGGGARSQRQLHHRLLHRELRRHGRAHRRLDHRGAGADADGQGIPDHARRLPGGAARDRRRNRRFQRAVRRLSRIRAHGRDRDEPARVALVGAGLQGHGVPDRQGRGQAGRGLHARRAGKRHHRRSHAGFLRAVDRLRGHQDAAFRLREVQRCRCAPDHADEVRGRGHGHRPQFPGIAAEGPARPGVGAMGLESHLAEGVTEPTDELIAS